MPHFCAAFGCANERNAKSKERGITFHRFPKAKNKREAWTAALRRANFEPSDHSVVCSSHFKQEDFDTTGQTTRLREGVIPSVFNFPDKPRKVSAKVSSKSKAKKTAGKAAAKCPDDDKKQPEDPKEPTPAPRTPRPRKTVGKAAAKSALKKAATKSPVQKAAEKPPEVETRQPEVQIRPTAASEPVVLDHQYTLDPINMKKKLTEAQEKVEELTRELRNSKDRERRLKRIVATLLKKQKLANRGVTTQA